MKKYTHSLGSVRINYYLHGSSPQLAIHSGTHGDEYQVINALHQIIKKYLAILPDFIYIPVMSPSSVSRKTRNNLEGLDLNRSFFEGTPSQEAEAIMDLSQKFPAHSCISFHEDPAQKSFYLYDTCGNMSNTGELSRFQKLLLKDGFSLFSGIDDPDDPILRFNFVDGYGSFSFEDSQKTFGTFACWAIQSGVIKRELMPEIPGQIASTQKLKLVDSIFQNLIIPHILPTLIQSTSKEIEPNGISQLDL